MMCPFRQNVGLDFMCNLHSANTSMFFGQGQLGRRSSSGHITVPAACIYPLFTDRLSCSHNVAKHSASWEDLF
jgi:hypothetical protein